MMSIKKQELLSSGIYLNEKKLYNFKYNLQLLKQKRERIDTIKSSLIPQLVMKEQKKKQFKTLNTSGRW